MNTVQVVIKTIVTTVDILLGLITLKSDSPDSVKKIMTVIVLLNAMGVWI